MKDHDEIEKRKYSLTYLANGRPADISSVSDFVALATTITLVAGAIMSAIIFARLALMKSIDIRVK